MIEFMGATIWDVCHKVKRVTWHKVFIWLVVPLKGTRERLSTEPTRMNPKPFLSHHTEFLLFFCIFWYTKWVSLVALHVRYSVKVELQKS